MLETGGEAFQQRSERSGTGDGSAGFMGDTCSQVFVAGSVKTCERLLDLLHGGSSFNDAEDIQRAVSSYHNCLCDWSKY